MFYGVIRSSIQDMSSKSQRSKHEQLFHADKFSGDCYFPSFRNTVYVLLHLLQVYNVSANHSASCCPNHIKTGVAQENSYIFQIKLDEDKLYIKVVCLEKIYDYRLTFFLFQIIWVQQI